MVDGDSLIKDIFSRGANYVYITTPADCGVLLQPIKDWWLAAASTNVASEGTVIVPKPSNPPNGKTALVFLHVGCTALIYISR